MHQRTLANLLIICRCAWSIEEHAAQYLIMKEKLPAVCGRLTDTAFLICYTYYFAHLLLLPEICCWLRVTITKAKRKRDIFQICFGKYLSADCVLLQSLCDFYPYQPICTNMRANLYVLNMYRPSLVVQQPHYIVVSHHLNTLYLVINPSQSSLWGTAAHP